MTTQMIRRYDMARLRCGAMRALVLAALVAMIAPVGALRAQFMTRPPKSEDLGGAAKVAQEVGIDQKLNSQVPLDVTFRDESGREVRLGEYFHSGHPVILTLAYYECPMLCTMVLNGVTTTLRGIPFDIGKEFEVVTVSINPKDTPELATKKKASYIRSYHREGAEKGWHFLTGKEENIKKLADAVGFRYVYDPKTDQYAHAGGMMILTPAGRVSRYFYGVEYSARDVRLGLVESSQAKIGSPVDQVLLLCYHYDPSTGRYGATIVTALKIGGALTILMLGGFILLWLRRDRRNRLRQELAVSGMSTINGQIK